MKFEVSVLLGLRAPTSSHLARPAKLQGELSSDSLTVFALALGRCRHVIVVFITVGAPFGLIWLLGPSGYR